MRKLSIKMKMVASDLKRATEKFSDEKGEFALSSVIGIAVVLIIAAFILIPGLRAFATGIINALNTWWTGTVQPTIFPNS